jgi:hypothetical protein
MEYKVAHDSDLGALMSVVNLHLKEGWQVCGGIAVIPSQPEGQDKVIDYFYQALVKRLQSEFHYA